MTGVTLRPYQTELVDGMRAQFLAGHRRVLGVLPTGGGKGRILAHIPAAVAQRGKRVIIMAHRGELLDQISAGLNDEKVLHGRIQPGHADYEFPVRIGMVQTIARRLHKIAPPDLLLIDEAHHAPANQYRAIAAAWPNARIVGVTATPMRSDGQGLGADFDAMVCGPSTADLMLAGHLACYDYYLPSPMLDLSGVAIERGDFVPGAALKAMGNARILGDAVAHYCRFLDGRPAIAFCMGVQHAKDVATEFSAAGIRAASIDGTMPSEARAAVLSGLASGTLDVLTAADVVSEGVDIPAVAGAILLRPTQSLALHLQQIGRALRVKADGSRAIILDHVGNAHRHGFPGDPRPWSLDSVPKQPAAQALRTCGTCFRVFPARAAAPCDRDDCGLIPGAPEAREPIAVAPGDLVAVADPWAWAGGVNIASARGEELASLMQAAGRDRARLAQIQRTRGSKPGWVWMQLQGRNQAA